MKDELDPCVEAALVAFCRLAGGNVGHWPSGASEHDRVTIRAAMAESLAAANAARPALTADDEERAIESIHGAISYAGWDEAHAALAALREHFDITPKVKS